MLTLLEVLQKQAVEEPERIYASCAISADVEDGFRDVTVGSLLSAIDAFAWWLHDGWGRSEGFDTIAYVGPSDLRYAIFFYAAIKCGYKTLFVSPLNSFEASSSIVEATECLRIFYAAPFAQVASNLQSAAVSTNLEVVQIASLDDCLAAASKPYPYEKTFEEAKWDPIVVIHTSGTTGLPKPMTTNFGFFSTLMEPLPPVPGYKDGSFDVFKRRTFLGPFPPFHLGGVYAMITIPAYCAATIVVPPPAAGPVSGETLVGIMTRKKVEAMFSATLLIEQIMRTPGGADRLKAMRFIAFAGAPLPAWCGDELSKHTTIKTFCTPLLPLPLGSPPRKLTLHRAQQVGSTETGNIESLPPRHPADWPYIKFHPALAAALEPVPQLSANDSVLHELVFPPCSSDDDATRHRANAWLFPHVAGAAWRSRDLFAPHPVHSELWRFCGRVDDVVTLADGDAFFPGPWEAVVRAHPRVGHVMVVEEGRARAGVLVEPRGEEGVTVEEVWGVVEEANAGVEEWARVGRGMVRVVGVGTLVRAPKGTVVRRASGEGHREVIEGMYEGDV